MVSAADWIKVKSITGMVQRSSFSSRLYSGEIEVILLAQETAADLLIMDDNAAKKTAKFLGFTVTGTMYVTYSDENYMKGGNSDVQFKYDKSE